MFTYSKKKNVHAFMILSRYSGRTSERKKRDSDDNQDGDEEDDKVFIYF